MTSVADMKRLIDPTRLAATQRRLARRESRRLARRGGSAIALGAWLGLGIFIAAKAARGGSK
jgi:hypothetical protein